MKAFDYKSLTQNRYRIIAPTPVDEPANYVFYDSWIQGNFRKLNYTVMYVNDTASGYADKYGNYTGFVGRVQRKEADFALHMVLLGGLEGEPVKHGDVLNAVDLHIYGGRFNSSSQDTDLFDAVKSFDSATMACYFVLLHVLCAILTLSMRKLGRRSTWSVYKEACWYYFTLVLGLNSCRSKSWPGKLLWLHLSFSVFIVVCGVFLNLMSADSIAEIRPRTIDGYQDIFDKHFSEITFHIIQNGFFYNYIKDSKPESKLAKIQDKLQSGSRNCKVLHECPFVKFGGLDKSTMLEVMKLARRCSVGKSAILFPRQNVEKSFGLFACRGWPDMTGEIHRSRDMITTGTLTTFLGHGVPDCVVRYSSYRMKRYTEMAVRDAVAMRFIDSMAKLHIGPKNSEYYKCIESYSEPTDRVIVAIIRIYRKTLFVCCCIVIVALVVSGFELREMKANLEKVELVKKRPQILWPIKRVIFE